VAGRFPFSSTPLFNSEKGFIFLILIQGSTSMKKWFVLSLVVMQLSVTSSWGASKTVILATTTSTQDSGLLDLLIPAFEKESGYQIKTISVGSGQAMKMGERGEADVLLVHSPDAEKTFMADGFGASRRLVMHNDFVIVGPPADPAKVRGAGSSVDALKRVARTGSLFASRGDNSGTHAKEKGLWKGAGVNPDGQNWYQQTGLGMGQTLNVAAEKKGYTLTDRATFLALKKTLGLVIFVEDDSRLLNIYHVIEINSARWPKVNAAGGKAFADYMVSSKAQEIIGRFGIDKFGAPLFFADAGKNPASLGL
jgi:tungstate transport system substrate-binding protein